MRRYLQIVAALAVAIGAGLFVHSLASPPPTVFVPFVVAPVAAGQRIAAADVSWRPVEHPPATALRSPQTPVGQRARYPLVIGQALSAQDLGGIAPTALKAGEVMWMASVGSAAASGLPAIGQRVDVWAGIASGSNAVSAPTLMATGVRVVGLFSAAGTPVGAAGAGSAPLSGTATGSAIGIIGLAVPFHALATLLAIQGVTFVVDPSAHHFHLTAPTPIPSPSKP